MHARIIQEKKKERKYNGYQRFLCKEKKRKRKSYSFFSSVFQIESIIYFGIGKSYFHISCQSFLETEKNRWTLNNGYQKLEDSRKNIFVKIDKASNIVLHIEWFRREFTMYFDAIFFKVLIKKNYSVWYRKRVNIY